MRRFREHSPRARTLARRLQVHGEPPQDSQVPQPRQHAHRANPQQMHSSASPLKNHALFHLRVVRLVEDPPDSASALLHPGVFVSLEGQNDHSTSGFSDQVWSSTFISFRFCVVLGCIFAKIERRKSEKQVSPCTLPSKFTAARYSPSPLYQVIPSI